MTSRAITSVPILTGLPEGYLYLNTGEGWPSLRTDALAGLTITAERELQLSRVPGAAQPAGPNLAPLDPSQSGGAGLAIDGEGEIYIADPAGQLVWHVACDGEARPIPSLWGPGSEFGQLLGPDGLAIGPRGTLYVVDSGNHRVYVVDLRTQQIRAILGQPGSQPAPAAGTANGRFDSPRGATVDLLGRLYVADTGNGRVQQFDAAGRVLPAFAATFISQPRVPTQPAYLAMMRQSDGERLLVVDAADGSLFVFGTDGALDLEETDRWSQIGPITAAGARGEALYAGTAEGAIRAYARDGTLGGEVHPFASPGAVTAFAIDCHEALFVRQSGGRLLRMTPGAAFVRCGTFLLGPVQPSGEPVRWQRVALEAGLPEGSQIELFTLSSNELDGSSPANTPGSPGSCAGPAAVATAMPGVDDLVPLDTWRAAPGELVDLLALNEPGRYLWVGGIVQGNGAVSPAISQLRVDFNHRSWIGELPGVYQRTAPDLGVADRMMLLFESMLSGASDAIDGLALLFDPFAVPDEGRPASWLDWLAGWLAIELPEDWPEDRRRRTVAQAFLAHGQRGTVESLRAQIALYTGATVHIAEPARAASIWSLGDASVLGGDTMLAVAYAEGAIVGSTATLGQSHLIADEDYGAPLFEDLAHRFCVSAYTIDLADGEDSERIREVIDREKPAHTVYDLCTIDANMRVGFQAQIGIDTIIAGDPEPFVPGGPGLLGFGSLLPGPAPGTPITVGQRSSLRRGWPSSDHPFASHHDSPTQEAPR